MKVCRARARAQQPNKKKHEIKRGACDGHCRPEGLPFPCGRRPVYSAKLAQCSHLTSLLLPKNVESEMRVIISGPQTRTTTMEAGRRRKVSETSFRFGYHERTPSRRTESKTKKWLNIKRSVCKRKIYVGRKKIKISRQILLTTIVEKNDSEIFQLSRRRRRRSSISLIIVLLFWWRNENKKKSRQQKQQKKPFTGQLE